MKQYHGKQQKRKTASNGTVVGKGSLPDIQPDVAGIDIGSREMYVCGPTPDGSDREIKVFATTTGAIQSCAQWLHQRHVRSVAMESTGVYWIPVLEILEGSGLETLLVDTRPLSRVPGKKPTWKIANGSRHCTVMDCYKAATGPVRQSAKYDRWCVRRQCW